MISVDGLDFSYGSGAAILDRVAFDAAAGRCVAVLGNNGAGKSTLVKCVARILEPGSGSVYVDGEDAASLGRRELARRVAYVAQRGSHDRLTVFDSVLLGRTPHMGYEPGREDLDIVASAIDRLGLEPLALRYVDELSGGEAQKVALARALAQRPRTLLLDEPTSNLDLRNQYETMAILRDEAARSNMCVIVVMHDLNLALRFCDRFLFMKDRTVYAYGGPEVVDEATVWAVYGVPVAVETVRGVPVVVPMPSYGEGLGEPGGLGRRLPVAEPEEESA